jgi:hypothetical protein
MRPQIESEVNIPTFVHELKDLRKLVDFWSKSRTLLQNAANAHLNYSFGWAPFLGDVWAIFKQLNEVKHRIEDFLDRARRPQKRHFQYVISASEPIVNTQNVSIGSVPRTLRHETRCGDIQYHATMVYRYTTGTLPDLAKHILGWLDAFGVNANPRTLWDAVPFSFVVDWFFGVGDWLNSLKAEWLPANVLIIDFCHSAKFSQYSEGYFTSGANEFLLWRSTWEVYTRKRAFPRTSPGIRYKGPSLGQFALAGSLGTTLSRKR